SGATRSLAVAGKHSGAGRVPGAASTEAPSDSTSSAGAPKSPSPEARALAEVVKRRYPHLTEAELETIASDLDDRLDSGKALRKLELGNGDEPDVTFRA